MGFKENQKDPNRRANILARRNKGPGTDPVKYFKDHKYVPGNGPNHKLGKGNKNVGSNQAD